MSRFLLDTNAVITLLNNNDSLLARTVRQHHPSEFYISSIVSHELFYGAFKSKRNAHNVNLVTNLQFEVLEFDKEDAKSSGEIRAQLALIGAPIGPYDVLIAGQAKARNLILITHNVGEFSRVDGLCVEDWLNISS